MEQECNFAEKLSCVLSQRGMTQRELANLAGVDECSMSRYVNGTRKPCMDVLVRMARTLGVSVEYLTGNDEKIPVREIMNLVCDNVDRMSDAQKLELIGILAAQSH